MSSTTPDGHGTASIPIPEIHRQDLNDLWDAMGLDGEEVIAFTYENGLPPYIEVKIGANDRKGRPITDAEGAALHTLSVKFHDD